MRPSRTAHSARLVCLLSSVLAACGSEATVLSPDAEAPVDVVIVDASATPDAPAADRAVVIADVTLPADPCPDVCARITAGTGCNPDMAACVRNCGTQLATTPVGCRGALDAWLLCGIGSTAACASGVTNFAGCDRQQTDLILCVASPDGGVDPCARKIDCAGCIAIAACGWCNNHCVPGNAAGPYTAGACGGQAWVRGGQMCR